MALGGGVVPFGGLTPRGVPRATATAVARPSPSAVPSPDAEARERIASTNARSVVGAEASCASVLKSTTATRYCFGQAREELPRRGLRRREPRGRDVARRHRVRRVDREHDGRLLGLLRDRGVRPGEAEQEGRDREQQDRGRQVPAPARHVVDDVRQQAGHHEAAPTRARAAAPARGSPRPRAARARAPRARSARRSSLRARRGAGSRVRSRSQSPSVVEHDVAGAGARRSRPPPRGAPRAAAAANGCAAARSTCRP